jgi:hypothetical protein
MHKLLYLTALLTACSTERSFGEAKPSTTTQGGDGRIEIFPEDGVTCETMTAGHTSTCGFRVNSTGENDLRLMSMEIINAGENGGLKVFDNLRPANDSLGFPISINTGEHAEFVLQASMSEEGSATGTIEILTNDGTVSDPTPGKIRIPLSATAVDYSSGDDTGDESGGDDTGDESGGDDTGDESGGDDTGDATSSTGSEGADSTDTGS